MPRKTGLGHPREIYYTDHSGAVGLLSFFCLEFSVPLFICASWSPAGKGLASWLSFVVSICEFVTFPLLSCVRCGT